MENSETKENPKIVLFEDDKNVKESVVEILTSENYAVFHLDSAVNLRSALDEIKPDLIVSDVMMPVKTGLDLIKEIKSIENYSDLPFIFLTARSDYNDLREGMNLGADDYLVKPFKAKDLLRSVELRIRKAQLLKKKVERFSKSVAISVPHELRTPLISLMGYSDLIIDDYETLSREEIIEYIKRIKFSTGRLHKVIEKFILYSNLLMLDLDEELKNQFLTKYQVDIEELISKEAFNVAESYNRKKDLKLNLTPCSLSVSEELLSFALIQLIDNAFKFSAENSDVNITGINDGNQYEIIISDHGIGIEYEQLKELNAFRQVEREKLNQSGSGLGLAIANKSLSLIGTGFSLESEPFHGTTLHIKISVP
ncbi:MAG TPA: response regulator [Melioribacteraceae bacterium]|nr:response regulator [Melioribacteraceae bacterium]